MGDSKPVSSRTACRVLCSPLVGRRSRSSWIRRCESKFSNGFVFPVTSRSGGCPRIHTFYMSERRMQHRAHHRTATISRHLVEAVRTEQVPKHLAFLHPNRLTTAPRLPVSASIV